MFLARLTWPQARDYFASNDIVLIGVGSIECHGRHNPLGTDTMAPDRLGQLVDERAPELLIAPTMPYGATDDLMGFPGTVSLGVEGLTRAMTSICNSLYSYGARRFVFVNGHGGNVKSLGCVCMELNRRGCLAALFNWWRIAPQLDPAWGGGHGDGMETSANLAIDPDSVDMAACAPEALRNDIGGGFETTGWTTVAFDGVEVDFPASSTASAPTAGSATAWASCPRTPPPSAAAPCSRARPTTSCALPAPSKRPRCPNRWTTQRRSPRATRTSRGSQRCRERRPLEHFDKVPSTRRAGVRCAAAHTPGATQCRRIQNALRRLPPALRRDRLGVAGHFEIARQVFDVDRGRIPNAAARAEPEPEHVAARRTGQPVEALMAGNRPVAGQVLAETPVL